jgi:hypothetical protein
MAEGIELILRFHPVGGEDVTVVCRDFASESEAMAEFARALDERRSLVLTQARYNRAERVDGVVINLANIVSARVSRSDSTDSGQYL